MPHNRELIREKAKNRVFVVRTSLALSGNAIHEELLRSGYDVICVTFLMNKGTQIERYTGFIDCNTEQTQRKLLAMEKIVCEISIPSL